MYAELKKALYMARDLTEPGEPNAEYIRGQVNLIMDIYGLCGNNRIYSTFTDAISHRIHVTDALDVVADEAVSQRIRG